MKFVFLPVDAIDLPCWWQEVKHRLDSVMNDLRASILNHGFVHPIVVIRTPEGRLLVIDGITRFLVAKDIGFRDIPAIVEEEENGDELDIFMKAVLFNMAQGHMGVISKLKVVRYMVANGKDITSACKLVGRSEQWFRKYRALLDLPKETQDMIERGEIAVSEVLARKDLESGYKTLPSSGSYSARKSFGRGRRGKAPECEICGKPVHSGGRKWVSVHGTCWVMLNNLLNEVLVFSRERNKVMFFCRGCGKMVGRADYSAGTWAIQRTLDSPGGGEQGG